MKENNDAPVKEEKKPSPFAGMKEQKGLKAKIHFFFDVLEKYPDVRQMILFTIFSMLCGLAQMGSQYLLQYTLILVPELQPEFKWFIFQYDSIALAIGFLVGSLVGQTLTYILNRKKTFRSTNNLALSVTLYIILAVGITMLQTLVPGWISTPCYEAYDASLAAQHGVTVAAAKALRNGFLDFLINLTGTFAGGIAAFLTSFLGNKFIVMRNWGEKKKKKEAESAAETTEENTDTTESK